MTKKDEVLDTDLPSATVPIQPTSLVKEEREPMSPIESRFLYVDVAAQRAKQLRRGALPRLKDLAPDPETGVCPVSSHKLERIAMEEVDRGLIIYELPARKTVAKEGS